MAGLVIRCYLNNLTSGPRAHHLIELKGGYMVFDGGGELPLPNAQMGAVSFRKLQPCPKTDTVNN